MSPYHPKNLWWIHCSSFFEAEDLDGEEITVSYFWTQNGAEVGTEASLQIDATNFSDDDVIACTVTVDDGYEGTASDSVEVVIGNTAPVIGSTTITPENPYSYETLTCTTNDVTDLEGDEVTISYEGSIDGEIQTETSDMLTGPFLVGDFRVWVSTQFFPLLKRIHAVHPSFSVQFGKHVCIEKPRTFALI